VQSHAVLPHTVWMLLKRRRTAAWDVRCSWVAVLGAESESVSIETKVSAGRKTACRPKRQDMSLAKLDYLCMGLPIHGKVCGQCWPNFHT
jgi:hypothetical protein